MESNETNRTAARLVPKKLYVLLFGFAALFGLAGGIWGASIFTARSQAVWKAQPITEIVVPRTGLLFQTPEGEAIAKLIRGNDGGIFTIFNNDGKKVLELKSYEGGGSFTLWNDESNFSLDMTADREGGTFALMDTRKGKNIIMMAPGADGGTITINDGHGDSVVKLSVDRKGGRVETFPSELK